jgi:Ca2+-binding RTX toxin-like protein
MAATDSLFLEAYGGQFNQDIVEFDRTVTLTDLSYRWNTDTGNAQVKTLELFRNSELFLQVDYSQNPGFQVGQGVEQFKFADGSTLNLTTLLGVLPIAPDPYGGNPYGDPYGNNPYGDPYGDPYGNADGSTFVLDASVLVSSLSYQWVTSDSPGVVKLELFQNGQSLVELDYDSSVSNTAQVRSLGGIAGFEFSTGDVLTLQDLLSSIRLEPMLPKLNKPLSDLVAKEDSSFALALPGDAFSDPQGRVLHFTASLQNGDALPSWLNFDANTGQFTGTPANDQVGILQIRVTATNDAGLSVSDLLALSVLNTNDAPVVATSLTNQDVVQDAAWLYEVSANSFVDVDAGDTLTYSATLADGSALPSWLKFDSATRTFSGTPGSVNLGPLSLAVIATDIAGASASASLGLNIIAATTPTNDSLPGNDTLTADTNNTPLHGGAGNDTLYGSWASSTLYGDSGNDVITATGGPSNLLDGGEGDDTLTGGWGQDTLRGGEGNNTITAVGGNSIISAGSGNDQITSSWGDDQIDAGDGNNTINAGGGNNTITTGSGIDIISADGSNTIHSGAGNDQITTTWGADNIDAGAGDDIIRAGGGGNTVRGGLGNDTIINDQWSDDRYLFARGDGQDVILDGGGQDSLTLENVRSDQLWFSQNGNDLELSVIGTQDHITLQNWYLGGQYPGSQYHMDQIKTSDGKTLLDSQVQNLVSAMAGFAPPAAGETTLSAPYQTALTPVLAANWQ